MPVEDVGQLLHRWRDAGNLVSKSRVVADGMRLLRGLSPHERRVLARALAEDGAPDLASRIEERSGHTLDATQLQHVADGLLGLDREQVDHLAATLTDPHERERLARDSLASASVAVPPPPATSPPSPTPAQRGTLTGIAGLHALARNEVPNDQPDLGDQALGHPELGEATLTEVALTEVALTEPQLHDVALHRSMTATSDEDTAAPVEPDSAAVGEPPAPAAGGPPRPDPVIAAPDHLDDPADHTDHAQATADGPVSVDVVDDDEGDEGDTWPAPVTSVGHAAVVDRLREAHSAVARFAVLSSGALAGVRGDGVVRVLEALPEGWQRRRAIHRLIAVGALEGADIPALMALFPGPMDAGFVAGALVEAGLTDIDSIGGAVPEQTRRRLAVRMAR